MFSFNKTVSKLLNNAIHLVPTLYFFGGAFNSSSQNENKTDTANVSGGASDDATSLVANDSTINYEVLDGGAIQSSYDFARESQAFFGETFSSVLGIVEKSVDAQGEVVGQYAAARANEDTKGIAGALIPVALIAAVGLVGYKVIK